MKSKHNNTNEWDGFQGIGKRLPYTEPDGFFDGMAERTLACGKERVKNRTRRLVVMRWTAVAASVLIVFFIGITRNDKPETHDLAGIPQTEKKQIEQVPVISDSSSTIIQKPAIQQKSSDTGLTQKVESVDDVLADLTDEELMQMEAMYKSDAFIESTNLNN